MTTNEYLPSNEEFTRSEISLEGAYQNYNRIVMGPLKLEKGSYTLSVEVDSNLDSMSKLENFEAFNPDSVHASDWNVDVDYAKEESHEHITHDKLTTELGSDLLHLRTDQICSKEWYMFSSEKLSVIENEEYLFRADVRSDGVKDRHMKVLFLDEYDIIVDSIPIEDIDEKYKSEWYTYEQLLRVPEGATQMLITVNAKGSLKQDGDIQIKNYGVYRYTDIPLVDAVILTEDVDSSTFFNVNSELAEVSYERTSSMSRSFTVDNPERESLILNLVQSPNPIWKYSIGEDSGRAVVTLNSVTTAIPTDSDGEGGLVIVLKDIYILGLLSFFLGLIMSMLTYYYFKLDIKLKLRFWRRRK